LFSLLPLTSLGQTIKQDSIWKPLQFFIGIWSGTGKGEPGTGNYERAYQFVLNKKYIEVNNKSTYPPSEANKNKGEIHEDLGFISYDGARKSFMLRQFHIEGFVNQYKLDSISLDKKTIVFLSESIENIPQGFRARETYKIINQNEFIETFEIAEPGKNFALYTEVLFKRKSL
jgi:hypothetical protein